MSPTERTAQAKVLRWNVRNSRKFVWLEHRRGWSVTSEVTEVDRGPPLRAT